MAERFLGVGCSLLTSLAKTIRAAASLAVQAARKASHDAAERSVAGLEAQAQELPDYRALQEARAELTTQQRLRTQILDRLKFLLTQKVPFAMYMLFKLG